MPVVRIDLEGDPSGAATIKQFGGSLKDLAGESKSAASAVQSIFQGIGQGIGQKLFSAIGSAVSAVGSFGKSSIQMAMDTIESENLVSVAFGDMGEAANKWSKDLSGSLGLNEFALRKNAGMLFTMTKSMGLSKDAAFDMATGVTALAEDMASFYNLDSKTAFDKIKSGLVGESEPLKALGILVDDNTIKHVAWSTGIAKAGAELTQQQKVQARYIAILQQTKDAQGDLARTIDSPTNMLRIMGQQVDQLKIQLGMLVAESEPLKLFLGLAGTLMIGLTKAVTDNKATLKSWVSDGAVLAATALTMLVKSLAYAVDVYTAFRVIILSVVKAVETQIIWMKAAAEAILHPTKALAIMRQAWEDTKAAGSEWEQQMRDAVTQNTNLQVAVGKGAKAMEAFQAKVETAAGQQDKATASTKAETAALDKLATATAKTAKEKAEATRIQNIVNNQNDKNRLDAVKRVNDQIEDEYKRNVKVISQILEKQGDAIKTANEVEARGIEGRLHLMDMEAERYAMIADAADTLASVVGGSLGTALQGVTGVFDAMAARTKQAADNLAQYGTTAMTTAQKIQAVVAAIGSLVNAYNAGKAAGSPGKGALAGAGKGAAAGAAFGPYGMVIGAVVGAGVGFFGGKKAQAEEARALTKEWEDLQHQAQRAGLVFDRTFDTRNAKSMRQAVRDLQEALAMKPLQDEFNRAIVAARAAGIQFDHTFDTHNAEALKDAIGEINRALDLQGEAQQSLNDAVKEYGFTIEEIGPAWARQGLDEQAAKLYQDWKLLTAGLVDHEAILARVGPKVGALVDQYVRGGVEIPQAMKPIIDDLYKNNKLVHENGDAYTEAEYKALIYGTTTSQMFQDVIRKVGELVDAIRNLVFPDKTVNIYEKYHPSNRGGGGGGGGDDWDGTYNWDGSENHDHDENTLYAATGFHGMLRSRTHIIAGEAGPERVDITPGGGGGDGMTEATGQELLTELRRMPKAIARATKAAVAMA